MNEHSVGNMQYLDKCKCCLEQGRLRSMWDEYVRDGKREIYGEMLTNCFALVWQRPEHEERICELCVGRLRNAITFKEQVMSTEQLLLDQMQGQDETEKNVLHSQLNETEENIECYDVVYEEVEYLETDDADDDDVLQENLVILKVEKPVEDENRINGGNIVNIELNTIQNNSYNLRNARKRKRCTPGGGSRTVGVARASAQISSLYDVAKKIKNETKDLVFGDVRITKVKSDVGNADVEHEEKPMVRSKHNADVTGDHSYTEEFITDSNHSYTEEFITDSIEEIASTDIAAENEEEVETTVQKTKKQKTVTQRPILRYQLYDKNPEREQHQDNLRTLLLCTNATPIRKRTDGGYMCAFCNDQFLAPAELKQHTIEAHDNLTKAKYMKEIGLSTFSVKLDISRFECKLCNENIYSLEDMLEHLKTVHKKKVHLDIVNYMIPLKFETEGLRCYMCGSEFMFFKLLTHHMTSVHYKNFKCEPCNIYFINNRALRNHARRHASGEFHCSYCPKIFDARIKVTHHERTVHHLGRYVIPCGLCDEKFKDNEKKLKHLEDQHGIEAPMYKCDRCEREFHRKKSLKRHVESFHLFMTKYKCDECQREFYEKRSFEAHLVSHSKVKAYECEVCKRKFGVKWSLELHRKIHYEKPKYKCRHCGHGSVQKNCWRLHMLRKHNEKV